jgi:tRNA(fMet)-specific endonuclease VapC
MISPETIQESRVLVDTNVVSYIFKNDPRAAFFQPFLVNRTLAISFMTVAELFYGAYKAKWQASALGNLETHLKNYVILPYDSELAREWAKVRVGHQSRGHDISPADAWIAATALRHQCALATNNGRHFDGTRGLTVIYPTTLDLGVSNI